MSTKTVDVLEAQNNLAELLSQLVEGTEIIITKGDTPVARLVPIGLKRGRVAGLHPGAAWMSEDFDAPLPDEFWAGV